MKPDANSTVALKSREQAHHYIKCGNYGRAFAHFLVALQLKPEWKIDLKSDFSSTLCTWGGYLESHQRYKDLFNCYEQAIEIFPENECVLCNLGSHLFRLGHLREAAHYFRQALDINDNYLPAYRNLQSVCNALVERWHFRMLNDTHRNEAYREAILKKVRQGFTSVLDIGTGTGILSLYAVSAGARDIHACDYSPTMCAIARDVLQANNMADKVTVVNKLSNNLCIPDDLSQRKSLVVTETMDAGLLGEHLLQTLLHAWEQLLKPPCPELLKTLDSETCTANHGVVLPFGAKLWAVPVQSHSIARKNFLVNVPKSPWNFSKIWLFSDFSEPYDTEDLRGGQKCKFLTEPVEIFCFDFNNPSELREYYEGKHDNKSVSFEYEGKADALAVWFDVSLDEDITISSSPFSEDLCCWDQAVFRFREPQESFLVNVSCGGGRLRFNQESKFGSTPLNSVSSFFSDNTKSKFSVSSETILFINDEILQDSILTVPGFCGKVLNVLDLAPFPMLGLRFVQQKKSNLCWFFKTEEELKAVKEFSKNNDIDLAKVKCLNVNELDDILSSVSDKFDFIFNNLFETSGELKEHSVNLIPRLIELMNPGGILAPSRLKVMSRLADCPWISKTTKVVNEELVQKYNIASFINVYQVSQQLDIDVQSANRDYLSEPFMCLQLTQEDLASESCFNVDINVEVIKDGVINALPLWYHYQILPSQEPVSTMTRDSYVNQVVHVVEPPCSVKIGDTIVISVTFLSGIMRLKVVC